MACVVGCPRADTRPYAGGWFCPDHTPARRRGHPEPDSAAYCAPNRCYCDREDCIAVRGQVEPITPNIADFRAVASGKRRAGTVEYRDAQAQVHGSRPGAA